MANSLIEMHDTRIRGIQMDGSDLVLDVDAYVHVSDGRPGVDAGTGWSRPVKITVRDGALRKNFDGQSLWISDGSIRLGERVFDNLLPLALDEVGAVQIEFVGGEGSLSITGDALRVETMGEGEYVERFPGAGG